MKTDTAPHAPDLTEAEIQHSAYLLWIEEGRPEGRDLAHWDAAREMLRHRCHVTKPTRRRAPAAASGARRAP